MASADAASDARPRTLADASADLRGAWSLASVLNDPRAAPPSSADAGSWTALLGLGGAPALAPPHSASIEEPPR